MTQPSSAEHVRLLGWRSITVAAIAGVVLVGCTRTRSPAESAPFPLVTKDHKVIAIPEDAVAVSLSPLAETSKTFSDHLSTYVDDRGITIEIAIDGDPTIAAMPRKPPLRPPSPEEGPNASTAVPRQIELVKLVERVGRRAGTGIRATFSAGIDESNARSIVDETVLVSNATAQAIGSVEARSQLAPANGARPQPFETAKIKIGGLTLERRLIPIGSFVSVSGKIGEWTSSTGNSWTVGMHLDTEGEVAQAAVSDRQSCVLLFSPPWISIGDDDVVVASAEDPALAGVWNVVCAPSAETLVMVSSPKGLESSTIEGLFQSAYSASGR